MKKFVLYTFLFTVVSTTVFAAVAPFGLEVGKAKLQQVKKIIKSKTSIKKTGINKWSNGVMLESTGVGLGINGLKQVTYIFYKDEVLAGILLTLDKNRYSDMLSSLKQKYSVINEVTPFVGSKKAKLKDGNVLILTEAPHMSFDMTISYLCKDLFEKYNNLSQSEIESQREKEASLL